MKLLTKKIDNTDNIVIIIFLVLSIWCVGLTWGFLYMEDKLNHIESSTKDSTVILRDTTVYHLKIIEIDSYEPTRTANEN